MGDALIVGRGGSSGSSSGKTLVTKIIQATQSWTVPKAKDQKFYVRIFGGGGGGSYSNTIEVGSRNASTGASGGGGGFMNNAELTLEAGTSIPITIGLGGRAGNVSSVQGSAGGTTSFGTYLAANGAKVTDYRDGGRGGSGGGGGNVGAGGTGYQFGGGGSSSIFGMSSGNGGNGGKWGGGGGGRIHKDRCGVYGGCLYYDNGVMMTKDDKETWARYNVVYPSPSSGLAGNFGENGINTIGNDQIPNGSEDKPDYELNLQGSGLCSNTEYHNTNFGNGGGGYGGRGGFNIGSGGGGYGGNGGNGAWYNNYSFCGGGGGGYGSDGGDGYLINQIGYYSLMVSCGGGGGGYGPSGKGGSQLSGYQDGGIAAGGAGGATNNLASKNLEDSLSAYDLMPAGRGGNGICIIQYYA